MNVLVTGVTGFLGTQIAKDCVSRDINCVGISHSEPRDKKFQEAVPEVKTYCLDLASDHSILRKVIKENKITHIVHCAAMKHIGICESNPTKAIRTNVIGSLNLIELANDLDVQNIVAVSTDKAISPTSVYGSSKLLMEKSILENGYSLIQGVNFFFSTGSVLDIWEEKRKRGEPIGVNVNNPSRYFVMVNEISKCILDNLEHERGVIRLDTCFNVRLSDLAEAFCSYHDYHNTVDYTPISVEKNDEEIPEGVSIVSADVDFLKVKLEEYYNVN